MYLEELILEGFKSYPVRTSITGWDPSFSAVTGLNGSGKACVPIRCLLVTNRPPEQHSGRHLLCARPHKSLTSALEATETQIRRSNLCLGSSHQPTRLDLQARSGGHHTRERHSCI
jgi:hypothetical protein